MRLACSATKKLYPNYVLLTWKLLPNKCIFGDVNVSFPRWFSLCFCSWGKISWRMHINTSRRSWTVYLFSGFPFTAIFQICNFPVFKLNLICFARLGYVNHVFLFYFVFVKVPLTKMTANYNRNKSEAMRYCVLSLFVFSRCLKQLLNA